MEQFRHGRTHEFRIVDKESKIPIDVSHKPDVIVIVQGSPDTKRYRLEAEIVGDGLDGMVKVELPPGNAYYEIVGFVLK